ncbi:hypothetical protein ACTHSL_01605 [Neisseria sp. P0008.S010]
MHGNPRLFWVWGGIRGGLGGAEGRLKRGIPRFRRPVRHQA